MHKKGFAPIIILLLIVIILILGGIWYYETHQSASLQQTSSIIQNSSHQNHPPTTNSLGVAACSLANPTASSTYSDVISEGDNILCTIKINVGIPAFTFNLLVQAKSITITVSQSGKTIQTINMPANLNSLAVSGVEASQILSFSDLNFDGYYDLTVPNFITPTSIGNTYNVYLYNTSLNQFVYNSFLSGLDVVKIDAENKTVQSADYSHFSSTQGPMLDTYQYENGRYVLTATSTY